MSWLTLGAVYFVVWWTILFAVLPWGTRTQEEDGEVVLGTISSAPVHPRLLRTAIATSIVAAVLVGVFWFAVEHYGRMYSRDHGLECINVRTCWVYGPHLPRLRVPRTFIEAALRGEALHAPDGADLAVDQVHVADTVAGLLLALDKETHRHDSYNIATGAAPTIADVAEAVNRAIPGARISVGSRGPYRHGGAILSAKKGALDISRARAELGYAPRYDLQRGIEATIEETRAALAHPAVV